MASESDRRDIKVGDLVEIGGHDEKWFGCYMRVVEVGADTVTGTINAPKDVEAWLEGDADAPFKNNTHTLSVGRDDIVTVFREIDLT
jgi:hypothetical protein